MSVGGFAADFVLTILFVIKNSHKKWVHFFIHQDKWNDVTSIYKGYYILLSPIILE